MDIVLSLPLEIRLSKTGKSKFIVNLNNYRNAHFQTLNKAKKMYSEAVKNKVLELNQDCASSGFLIPGMITECKVEITLFPKTKRRVDHSNPCSICEKFTNDALTEMKVWGDDDSNVIVQSTYKFGSVDPENPRFEYRIYDIKPQR